MNPKYGSRVEGPTSDQPSQSKPAKTLHESPPPQPDEERAYVREESDPEAAFRAHVARLSKKLKPLLIESPHAGTQSVTDRTGLEAERGPPGLSAEQNQQELTEKAKAASTEARELKAQLDAAEQRIADLTAETEASRASSMARSSTPGPASPEPPRSEPKASPGFLRPSSVNYMDPKATSQLLRQTTARRKRRGRVILVAGLAVPLVALLIWGAVTVIQPAGNEQIPPTTEASDPMDGSGSADGGQSPIQPENAALLLEPTTGKLAVGGAVPLTDVENLTAAQLQIARLSAAVEASDIMIRRLRDELVVARQQAETARQTTPTEPNLLSEKQQRELMLAAIVPSARVVALQRELERERQRISDLSNAVGSAEDASAKLRGELSARPQEAAAPEPSTGSEATAPSDQIPVADQKDPDQVQNAEISSDPVTSEPDAASPAIDSVTNWVQLGGFKNPDNASTVWLNLRRSQSDLLGHLHHEIRQIYREGQDAIYLLQVGPLMNTTDAKTLCHILAEQKVRCLAIERSP